MNELWFDEPFSPWEAALSRMERGSVLSAARFVSLLEQDQSVEPEQAAMELEEREILLDLTGLPVLAMGGKTQARLELEERGYRAGTLMNDLESNDPLRLTLEQLEQLPVPKDVDSLARRAAQGDDAAMETLTNGLLPMVYSLAGEYIGKGVLLVDLIQEGSLGLWQGIRRYREGDFSAFCARWIRQAMARAVVLQAHANGVGNHMAQAMERYRQADRALLARLGRNPVPEEIALEMGISPEETIQVGKMLEQARQMEQVRHGNAPEEPQPEDEQAVEDTALFQSRQRIQELLSQLSQDDARLLTMRFGLDGKPPMSAAEVGQALGLSAAEISAREAAALASLRKEETK